MPNPGVSPPTRPVNPPLQNEIAYRLGGQSSLREWMLKLLRASPAPSDEDAAGNSSLAISAEDRVGFVAALVDAWAAVGDNLTFYQERIANEGFLRTAREDFSLRALLGGVGYRPRPAVSATTFLSFKLLEAKGAPERVTIDKGVAVQSVPAPGQASVVFETDESLEARPEWNAIRPSLPEPPPRPVIEPGVTTQLRVKGAGGFLQAGMLLIARAVGGAATPQARLLAKVEPDPTAARTLLAWRPPFDADPDLKRASEIYVCAQQAALFGVNAPAWASQPDDVKARYGHRVGVTRKSGDGGANWTPVEAGLPPSGVAAFAFAPDGALLAALGDSVFANAPDAGWTRRGTPIVRHNILVLATSANGQLHASTQNGEVLCSNDGGANWFALVGPQGRLPPKGVSARLPAVPVGALSVLAWPGEPSLVIAGTASGVWTAPAHGGDWTPWNKGFLGYDSKTLSASVDVRALMRNPSTGVYLAATDNGIYRANEVQAHWRPVSPRVSANAKTPLDARSLAVASDGVMFASASGQLLTSLDNGESWSVNPSPAPAGLGPLVCAGASLFGGCAAGLYVSTDRGTTWSPSGQGAGRPISALAAGGNQVAFAETFGGYADTEWPGLVIDAAPSGQDLYLDRAYPSLAPGALMGLVDMDPATGRPATRVLSIVSVATRTHQAFTQTARVTRVGVVGLQGPVNPRSAQCHILARQLDPIPEAEEQPAAATLAGAGGGTCDLALEGSLTGLDGRRVSLAGRRARLRIDQPAGGVRHWNAAAAKWSPTGTGNHNVNAMLLSSAHELLLAGQVDVRVFRNGDWAVFGGASLGREAFCLAEIGNGTFLAGAADGLWRCQNAQSWECMAMPGQRINALAVDGDAIFAGAPSGLNLSADAGKTWGNPALAGKNVTALLQTPNKTWIAGTGEGELYFQGPEGWTLATGSPTGGSINAFAASADKRLYAGARAGAFVCADEGRTWGPLYPASPPCDVRALAIGNDGVIWAAARGQGVLRGAERLSTGIANDIRALVLDKDGVPQAGSRFASALSRADGAPDREISEPEFAKQFEDGQLAGLLFDTGALSEDLRRIFQERNLPLPDGARLTKLSDRSWRVGDDGPSTYAIFDMGANQYRVMRETGLEIASQPRAIAGLPAGASRWELLTFDKVLVTLDSLPGQTSSRNADPSADLVCEIARVGSTEPSPDLLTTVVALASPPKNVFDAATLTINANVAPASHGESAVLAEVLGSGDRAIPNQTFTLRKRPVTALQGASPLGK